MILKFLLICWMTVLSWLMNGSEMDLIVTTDVSVIELVVRDVEPVLVDFIATDQIAIPTLPEVVKVQSGYRGNPIPEAINDENFYNGWHYDLNDKWIPGMPTYKSQFMVMPDIFMGSAWPYGSNVMEGTAREKELSLEGFVDGVALMTCADQGGSVWLQRPGHDWEGPFRVVDCARRTDLYNVAVHRAEAVEVGFKTALKWGMATQTLYDDGTWLVNWKEKRIDGVIVSKIPPDQLPEKYGVVNLKEWFLDRVVFDEFKTNEEASAYYNSVPRMLYRPPTEEGGLPYWRIPPSDEFIQFDLDAPTEIYGTSLDYSDVVPEPSLGIASDIVVRTPTSVIQEFTVENNEFWIEVDLSEQVLYAHRGNEVINQFVISSGLPLTPTPLGSFQVYAMYTEYTMLGQEGNIPGVPWSVFFHHGYALHGVDWHDDFGKPVSRGCINLSVDDAQWIYSRVEEGTHIYIHI